jgi:DNA repair photolyase
MQLNDDGYSVKGCSYIYAPKGQAGEYARLAANPYRGCGHKCAYCYVPQVLRMDLQQFLPAGYENIRLEDMPA